MMNMASSEVQANTTSTGALLYFYIQRQKLQLSMLDPALVTDSVEITLLRVSPTMTFQFDKIYVMY